MIVDCIADLHGVFPELEGGDLLIVAGDLTAANLGHQYLQFLLWLKEQKYSKKIVVGGNHDGLIAGGRWKVVTPFEYTEDHTIEYLEDSGTEFEGLKIWGSPWTKTFPGMNPHCKAFTVDTEEELAEKFSTIPHDVDILVTHSPPYGILDAITLEDGTEYPVGSKALLLECAQIKPLMHVFGHIHEKGGKDMWLPWKKGTRCVNASIMSGNYDPDNKPVRVIL